MFATVLSFQMHVVTDRFQLIPLFLTREDSIFEVTDFRLFGDPMKLHT